jgi:hypothetical protein
MYRRAALPLLLLALVPRPAWAVKEWYDQYLLARDQLMREQRWSEALASLQEAVKLRPTPALNEQTYGLQFVDYLPYYHMGACYLKLGDYNSAIRMFNISEKHGAIVKSGQYRDLLRQRTEAENAERQRVARLAREEVQRLLREAAELARGRRWGDALARLAQAQAAAESLDPATRRLIQETITRTRAEEKEAADAAARAQRIEQALADGRRLLDESKPTEAVVRFDEVLGLDPRNVAAQEGKRDAQDHILASTTRQARLAAFQEGRTLFEAGRYEESLRPLTDAAADSANAAARDYIERARAVLERLRREKELSQRVARLLGEGERLLGRGQYPEAQVKFEGVLQLDSGNLRAQGRRDLAERKTGEEILGRWLPNRGPELTFFAPARTEVEIEGPTASVVGVATDDRTLTSVEFRVGDKLVAQMAPPPLPGAGASERILPFQREFPLQAGLNEVTVTATDGNGVRTIQTFKVTRRLRFYETRAFLPSALGTALGVVGLGLALQRARRRRAVRSRFNPYIAGAPVLDDEMFFGRQKLLARIMNVLHHNSLMITGERRIGKTTFLYHLKKELEADQATDYRFFPVFTDLQGVAEDGFFHAVMADVVEALRLEPETLAALRFRTEGVSYDGRDFSHDLQRVIAELKTRTSRQVKLALLIDEVDVLNEYSERINQRLRSIFMKTFSEHLVAIMSGVGIKRTWQSEVSPWYNFFDEIELGALSPAEAEDLIRRPVEGIFRYQPEAVEAILAASQLKPYEIQKFCIHAVGHILEAGRTTITAADVDAVRSSVQAEGARTEPPRDYAPGQPAPA